MAGQEGNQERDHFAALAEQLAASNAAMAQMMTQMGQMVQMMANNNQGNGDNNGENHQGNQAAMSKSVQQKNPPTYNGKGDPVDLDNWIREMDKIFASLGCPGEYRVKIAAFYLKEDADLWWQARKVEFETPEVRLGNNGVAEGYYKSWEEFQGAIKEEFFPEHMRTHKRLEFEMLKQTDDMSIKDF